MKYEHEEVSNVFWHYNIDRFHSDGSIDTVDGKRIENIDVVIYCTGYEYSFPFFKNEKFPEGETIVHAGGRRVNNCISSVSIKVCHRYRLLAFRTVWFLPIDGVAS